LRYWKLVLGLLVVFLAGAVVGGIGSLRYVQKQQEDKMNADNWAPGTLQWLRKELALTPDQEAQVRPIVEESMAEMRVLRDTGWKERDAIFARMFARMWGSLTPEQRGRLEALDRKSKQQKGLVAPATTPREDPAK
jgi:hypothetical protein